MSRRFAVVALWLAVVATALAVPAPTKEDQATVQQKGKCVGVAFSTSSPPICVPSSAWFSQHVIDVKLRLDPKTSACKINGRRR
jgi:uncharacterized membrane protein